MKEAIQQGFKLSSNAQFDANPLTKSKTGCDSGEAPLPFEFKLSSGGSVRVYSPEGFAALRELAGIEHNSFFASLTHDELLGGATQVSGKSGALFWFSADGRFVLKTVTSTELRNLLFMLPKYERHLQENRDSLLTRFFGAYCFTLCEGGDEVRIVAMNNVLEGARHHKVYDLKGTTENRWVEEAPGKCLKDLNFEDVTLYMNAQVSEKLHAVLHSDTSFLEELHIMDYSLILSIQYLSQDGTMATNPKPFSNLMGGLEGTVCGRTDFRSLSEACVFHIGLIDMLTTYGLKKQVSNALKSNTIGHFCEIDTEPPGVYAERFRKHFRSKLLGHSPDEQWWLFRVSHQLLAEPVSNTSQTKPQQQLAHPAAVVPSSLASDLSGAPATPRSSGAGGSFVLAGFETPGSSFAEGSFVLAGLEGGSFVF